VGIRRSDLTPRSAVRALTRVRREESSLQTQQALPVDEVTAELLAWVDGDDEMWPYEDFDLCVTAPQTADLLLDLAAEGDAARLRFFLRCLYLLAGDAVRTNYSAFSRQDLLRLVERAQEARRPVVRGWANDVVQLMTKPSTFDYSLWCDGGLARQAVPDQ
jgi:hypothetical protein